MDSLVINGWSVRAHPLFIDKFDKWNKKVENPQAKVCKQGDPDDYPKKGATKRREAIRKRILEVIPRDPADTSFRQGSTLGQAYKHWRRAKFQQYRLFFRFHQDSRVIVLAWVNDQTSKRAYGAKSDAYYVFQKMLSQGHPPNDWDALVTEAKSQWWPG